MVLPTTTVCIMVQRTKMGSVILILSPFVLVHVLTFWNVLSLSPTQLLLQCFGLFSWSFSFWFAEFFSLILDHSNRMKVRRGYAIVVTRRWKKLRNDDHYNILGETAEHCHFFPLSKCKFILLYKSIWSCSIL